MMNVFRLLFNTLCILFLCSCAGSDTDSVSGNSELSITITADTTYRNHLQIELENSVYKAVMRSRERFITKYGKYDTCLRDWILKRTNQDQVESCIDGSAHRLLCTDAQIMEDSSDRKTVRLSYGDEYVYQYSIFPDSPVIQIDYLQYGNPGRWCNVVDIAAPGGITENFTATTRIYGQENWVRDLTYHHDCYWSIHYDPDKSFYRTVDDSTAGSLNYKGHLIMAVASPENGTGFGRVMPIFRPGSQGGVRVLKLLWDKGFEPFISTGQTDKPPFTGYIFVFDQGLEEAIAFGKTIVDQNTVP